MRSRKHRLQMVRDIGMLTAFLVLAGCVSQAPRDTGSAYRSGAMASDQRLHLVRVASDQIGVPYRYGGSRPDGFDCSGLVQFTHARAGIRVPRTARDQWRSATPLQRGDLLPGDLLFFSLGNRKPQHVGIYEGDGLFIHAPSSGKTVTRASLDNPYWRARWIGSGTFL